MDAPEPKGEANEGSAAVIARHEPSSAPGEDPVEVAPADAVAWLASRSGEGRIDVATPATQAAGPGQVTPGPAAAGAPEPEPVEVTAADALAWLESQSGEGRIEPDDELAAPTAAPPVLAVGDPASAAPLAAPEASVAAAADASTDEGAALFCRIAERAGVLPAEQAQSLLAAWRLQPSQGADALARATLALGLLTPAQVEGVLRLAGLAPQAASAAGPSLLPDGPEFALLVRLKRLASDGDLAGCAALQVQLAGTVFARLGDVIVRKAALARGAPAPAPSPRSTPAPVQAQPPRPARPTPTPVRAARRQAFDLYVRLKQAVARGDTAEAGALREQLRDDPEFDRLAEGLVRKVWGRQALVSARTTGASLLPCPGCKTPAPADAPCPRCGAAPAPAPAKPTPAPVAATPGPVAAPSDGSAPATASLAVNTATSTNDAGGP